MLRRGKRFPRAGPAVDPGVSNVEIDTAAGTGHPPSMPVRRTSFAAWRPGAGRGARVLGAGVLLFVAAIGAAVPADDAAYDRAAARLADRIEAIPRNQALRRAIDDRLGTIGAEAAGRLARALEACRIAPMRVPGLFHESHPQSGADLSAVPDWFGAPVPMIRTDEVGTRDENAETIARAIVAATRTGGRVALLSVSKGSADVATALASHPEIRPRVAIWIDLVGAIDGTPLLDSDGPARAQSESWLPARTADSLAAGGDAEPLSADDIRGIFVVHVAAFPRVADVSDAARPAFAWLRTRGVNDGYVLLEHALRRPGRTLVVRHVDHYLRSDAVPARVVAALHVALDSLGGAEGDCAANAGAAAHSAPGASERAVEHPEDADGAKRMGRHRTQETPGAGLGDPERE